MPRYIDIEPFETEVGLTGCCIQTTAHICDGITVKNTNTKDIPTIDPESLRPHGRWEKSEDGYCGLALLECSLCRGECFDIDEDIELLNYRYCPNCGAKMDEEENDA